MAEQLIGTDIAPPDLVAKVTGRAKYAEDFRADGMVFAKLLLSPMPHARVRRIDTRRAEAMEGVVGVLTANDIPAVDAPGEAPLTMEPLYQGEPILAIAAVDETIAANAIEAVDIDLQPLPFALDPLQSLRPGGPNARTQGNTYVRTRESQEFQSLKWPQSVFDGAPPGTLPMGEPQTEWTIGDIDAGFAAADHVIEETLSHQSLTHHPMEPRSAMAYWQNGKLFIHGSTQSVARAHAAVAAQMDLDVEDVVFVGEYCGGGFGSKITTTPVMLIPAHFSRKLGRPVMMRINRYEEHYVGRARPGFQAWTKIGFKSDGRITALDLYIVQDHGPYGLSGDHNSAASTASLTYQPENMRFRGVTVYTNTPPRAAQRAPGGGAIVAMLEPLMDKAARELGVDRVQMRLVNAPEDNQAWMGANQRPLTSNFVRRAIRIGAERFDWAAKTQLSGQRQGTKATGIGIGVSPYSGGSSGFDGLLVVRPDGRLYIHQGIGNLGTHSFADTARVAAEILGMNWRDCQVVWGDTSQGLPWSSVQAGSQTTHAHTRANHAAAMDALAKLQAIAAMDLGGTPADYMVDEGRVFRRANRARGLTFARAAERAIELGGRFDGHELPEDIHAMTVGSATALAGQGLMGVARDNYGGEGAIQSWVVGFAHVEVDVETGHVDLVDYLGSADCGVVLHPRSLAAQIHGGAVQGFGMARSQKWVMDPKWGAGFANRLYTARPPGILDVPLSMDWVAVGEPDPQTPVGARGIGEPPLGAGAAAITSAIADALGGQCLCRTPLTTDVILAALEGREQPFSILDAHV